MTTLKDFINRFKALNDDFNIFTAKSYPATIYQIYTFEEERGWRLPPEAVAFLTHFGQFILEVKEEVWKRPVPYDIQPKWKFGYGFFILGITDNIDAPVWLNYNLEEDDDPDYQLFFRKIGNSYRAYFNCKGEILVDYGYVEKIIEPFDGNMFDFLISEIDIQEKAYYQYLAEKSE